MESNGNNGNGESKEENFEQEIRRSRVIRLHSKGLTQSEIAHQLNVDS